MGNPRDCFPMAIYPSPRNWREADGHEYGSLRVGQKRQQLRYWDAGATVSVVLSICYEGNPQVKPHEPTNEAVAGRAVLQKNRLTVSPTEIKVSARECLYWFSFSCGENTQERGRGEKGDQGDFFRSTQQKTVQITVQMQNAARRV